MSRSGRTYEGVALHPAFGQFSKVCIFKGVVCFNCYKVHHPYVQSDINFSIEFPTENIERTFPNVGELLAKI